MYRIKKRQTCYYLPEGVRQWVARKAKEKKVSRSVYMYAMIMTAIAAEKGGAPMFDEEFIADWFS